MGARKRTKDTGNSQTKPRRPLKYDIINLGFDIKSLIHRPEAVPISEIIGRDLGPQPVSPLRFIRAPVPDNGNPNVDSKGTDSRHVSQEPGDLRENVADTSTVIHASQNTALPVAEPPGSEKAQEPSNSESKAESSRSIQATTSISADNENHEDIPETIRHEKPTRNTYNSESMTTDSEQSSSDDSDQKRDEYTTLRISQRKLIKYARRANPNANVKSLLAYIRELGFETEIIQDTNLIQQLSLYVVCFSSSVKLRKELVTKYLDLTHDEQFLHEIWKYRTNLSSWRLSDADIYQGPWRKLIKLTGRVLVAQIIVCTVVLKPFMGDSWVQLWGNLKFPKNQLTNMQEAAMSSEEKLPAVNKMDIMYRRKVFYQYQLSEDERSKMDPLLLNKIYKTEQLLLKFRPLIEKSSNSEFTPPSRVSKIINKHMRKLFPASLFGSKNNSRNFEINVLKFLKIPGHMSVSISFFARNIKYTEISWIRDSDSSTAHRQNLLYQLLFWAISKVVKPLLRHLFYISELSGSSASIYYYDHITWNQKCVLSRQQHRLQNIHASKGQGEKWRLIPKSGGGTRLVINLKEKNKTLQDAHLVLHSELPSTRSNLPSWHDWLPQLLAYKKAQIDRNLSSGHHDEPEQSQTNDNITTLAPTQTMEIENPRSRFYVVKFDISNCYDTADVNKVKELAQDLLKDGEDSYKCSSVLEYNTRTEQWIPKKYIATENKIKFDSYLQKIKPRRSKGVKICLERGVSIIDGSKVLEDINDLMNKLRLQVTKSTFVEFNSGIPQGSSCSNDLCDMLMNDLVAQRLRFAQNEDSLLLRYVDDFLFVSTDKSLAERVHSICLSGFKEHGLYCSRSKVFTNFGSDPVNTMKFLGLEFSCDTLTPCKLRTPDFMVPGITFKLSQLKSRINQELNQALFVLISYDRANAVAPDSVVLESAFIYGKIMRKRFDYIRKISGLAPDEAYFQTARVFLRYVVRNKAKVRNRIRSGFIYVSRQLGPIY